MRMRIQGSTDADGIVTSPVGQGIASIDGASWNIFIEFSRDNNVTWKEDTDYRWPSVTATNGLVVNITASVHYYNEIFEALDLVQLVYLNRTINPPGSGKPPFGFTVPSYWPQRGDGGGTQKGCTCGCCRCCRGKAARVVRRCCG